MQLARFILSDGVFSDKTPEGYIVMSPSGQMYRFNGIGEYILSRCDGRHGVSQIIDAILDECSGTSVEVVTNDVKEFVAFLVDRELIQQVDAEQVVTS